MTNEVGLVGSPSTTAKVTVDIMEDATDAPLRGQVVSLVHPLSDSYLIAIGTVTDIRTSNRWHEDSNMRGVLKRHGSLPHLSAEGDVRTADVAIQAVYEAQYEDPSQGDPPTESAAALGMSPTTGANVRRVTDGFLRDLLRKHSDETISLGTIYGMEDVRLPMVFRHFGASTEGGAGEAYHSGVFGMTGSGKSGFATYFLGAYARQSSMSIFVIDPQGQFATERGLPFEIQEWMRSNGRRVDVLSLTRNLRLPKDAPFLTNLLEGTRFFRDYLNVRGGEQRESAVAEFERMLDRQQNWEDTDSEELLRTVLTNLSQDERALQRIYAGESYRDRLRETLHTLLTDEDEFEQIMSLFQPLHSLFTPYGPEGERRRHIWGILQAVLEPTSSSRPYVVLDVSGGEPQGGEDSPAGILESAGVKAHILRRVCSMLESAAKQKYREGQSLNTMVVLDEAQRFAAETADEDEVTNLSRRLVDYVRETRKYGLGWTFITQEVNSLRRGIYSQLRVRAFGYGLTSGTELARLRETIGDPESLELYRSFVDPQSVRPSKYPFMITGPVSPLSFTGSPLFLSVYTDFDKFKSDNGFD